MSIEAKPFRIGVFVIGAAALLLAALIVFGSGELFRQKFRFVSYFPESATGLAVGSSVRLRGVPVGAVSNIVVRYDAERKDSQIGVYYEIFGGSIDTDGEIDAEDLDAEIGELIEDGLRARLASESLVTGRLYVELVVDANAAPAEVLNRDEDFIEVPGIPSKIAVLETELQEFLGGDGSSGLGDVVARVERLLNDENLVAIGSILANIEDFTAALDSYEDDVGAILASTKDAVGSADAAVGDARGLIMDLRETARRIDGAVDGIGEAASSVARMADQANNAVAENRPGLLGFTTETLPAINDISLDVERLALTLNRIADQMEADPSGFIFGRGDREGIR